MRRLFNKTRILRPPQFVEAASLYEHQSAVKWGSKHREVETTLFVVFDRETRHHFSSARIVLYYDKVECNKGVPIRRPPVERSTSSHVLLHYICAQRIRQLGPVTHNLRGQVHHAPPNDSTLPQFTLAFKVVPLHRCGSYYNTLSDLVLQSSDDELCNRRHGSVHVLLESEVAMTPDTLSLSMAFEHSSALRIFRRELRYCNNHQLVKYSEYGIIRIVRVVPEVITRPRATTRHLPTELLIKIFEDIDSCEWQHDLLSFAQVCRGWSCSLRVLFARSEYPERANRCKFCWLSSHSSNPYAFAKAFNKTPALGLGIQRLVLDEHVGLCHEYASSARRMPSRFPPALVDVLRATKDLQHLHISQSCSSRANKTFSALPELSDLRTLTVTQPKSGWVKYCDSISTLQLARCMTRWPTLTSLTVKDLAPGSLGMRRFFMRPPACALTQLCIRRSHISNTDLLYLTASSANTLVQVTLDHLYGITCAGLHTFLDSISKQVISLTVVHWRDPYAIDTTVGRALDTLVDKMSCLEVLNIGGEVASECMLRRRSEMFARSRSSGDAALPVVRLSTNLKFVPGLKGCIRDK